MISLSVFVWSACPSSFDHKTRLMSIALWQEWALIWNKLAPQYGWKKVTYETEKDTQPLDVPGGCQLRFRSGSSAVHHWIASLTALVRLSERQLNHSLFLCPTHQLHRKYRPPETEEKPKESCVRTPKIGQQRGKTKEYITVFLFKICLAVKFPSLSANFLLSLRLAHLITSPNPPFMFIV